ncbi:MAG: hypothetical protein K2P70_04230 [Hyphomonadaceae bacterium]|nr:hypothetical protein [Hyphomonadaceae bacterium]
MQRADGEANDEANHARSDGVAIVAITTIMVAMAPVAAAIIVAIAVVIAVALRAGFYRAESGGENGGRGHRGQDFAQHKHAPAPTIRPGA